jgi:hypothetical protein
MKSIQTKSVITCPFCGTKTEYTMPEDSCVFFVKCPDCEKLIKLKDGDCCVFCSYGSAKCPPKQHEEMT